MLPEERLEEAWKQIELAHDDLPRGSAAESAAFITLSSVKEAVRMAREHRKEQEDAEVVE